MPTVNIPVPPVVIIPTHNYGRWIGKAIESAQNQTIPCKIVIVDDGSTDNTQEIVKSFVEKDSGWKLPEFSIDEETIFGTSNIRYIGGIKPKGPSWARNQAIRATWDLTDYWINLDADDEMYPTKVEKFVKVLEDENIGIVYADYDTFEDNGPLVRNYKEPFHKGRLLMECVIHSGAGFSKKALMKRGFNRESTIYDEQMRTAEDWNLWLMLTKTSLAHHIPESLTKVRIHNNNATNSVSKETWNKNWALIRERFQTGYYN